MNNQLMRLTRSPSPSYSILKAFIHSIIFLLGGWSSSFSICHRWAVTYTFACQNLVRGRYFQALQGPIYAVINDQRLRQERGTCKTNNPGICINVREKEERLQSGGQGHLETSTKPAFSEENHNRLRKGDMVDLPEVAPRGTHHGMRIPLDSGSVEESKYKSVSFRTVFSGLNSIQRGNIWFQFKN